MANSVQELRVFLASPGDVAPERAAIRQLQDNINNTFAATHLRVRVTGYEDLPAGFGRPQGLINPMVDAADIVIGIMRRRWGTPTGEHETGFIEEFERARNRRIAHGTSPEISLYFAELSQGEKDDPGADLKRVLAFKTKVASEHIALYNNYQTPDDLTHKVSEMLHRHLIGRLTANPPTNAATGSDPSSSGETKTAAISEVAPENNEQPGGAAAQIFAVLDTVRALVQGQDPDTKLDSDRLELLATTLSNDDSELGSHLTNRLYQRRQTLDLLVGEHTTWVSALLTDIGIAVDEARRTIPGWAIVDLEDPETPELLAQLAQEEGPLGRGALRSLNRLQLRPNTMWIHEENASTRQPTPPPKTDTVTQTWLKTLNAHDGNHDATAYLLHDLRSDRQHALENFHQQLSALVAQPTLNAETRDLLNNTMRALDGDPNPLAHHLPKIPTDSALWDYVLNNLDRLDSTSLNALSRSDADHPIRARALQAAIDKNALEDQTLDALLSSTSTPTLLAQLLEAAEQSRELASRALRRAQTDGVTARPTTIARLTAANTPVTDIAADHLANHLSVIPWEALTYAEPDAHLENARHLLKTNAAEQRQQAQALVGEQRNDLVDYLVDEFSRAAANLLARQPNPSRNDTTLVLNWIDTSLAVGYLQPETFEILENVAASANPTALTRLLEKHDRALINVQVIQHLDHEPFTPLAHALGQALLQSENELFTERTKRWHLQQTERTTQELEEALYAENPHERHAAAETLTQRLPRDQLLELQERYPHQRSRYWYNVVATFDQAIHAPTPTDDIHTTPPGPAPTSGI